jgi:hypothetical protein
MAADSSAAAQQRAGADEAGTSDGASALNPVFARPESVRGRWRA